MKFLGNLIWLIFGGLAWSLMLFLASIFCFITIIFIPIGLVLFKMAGFVLSPFGKEVTSSEISSFYKVLNIIWALTIGLICAVGLLLTGLIYIITIIGIPFGLQYFKLAKFVLTPIGKNFSD